MKDNNQDFIARSGSMMVAAGWIAFLGFLYFIFQDAINERINPNQEIVTNDLGYTKEVALKRNRQGHYVATGNINDQPVTFLLDTGATDVAVPEHIAYRIGLIKGRNIMVNTANGTAPAWRTSIKQVGIGELNRNNVRATILSNMQGDEVLLGMSYLKHFQLIQQGNFLTIRQ